MTDGDSCDTRELPCGRRPLLSKQVYNATVSQLEKRNKLNWERFEHNEGRGSFPLDADFTAAVGNAHIGSAVQTRLGFVAFSTI